MESKTPQINIIQHDETPKDRKDIVLMNLKAIRDANATGTIDQQINAIIYFIQSALPEIPPNFYNKYRYMHLEPPLKMVYDEYFSIVNVPVKEARIFHMGQVRRYQKEKHLRLLQIEQGKIHELLKKHTGWMFDDNKGLYPGK